MYRHARILEAAFKCRPQVKRVSHSCRSVASFPFWGPANLLDLCLRRKLRPALQRLHGRSNKKLSYRRGTARCVVSMEILPIATQQCRNYLYDKSWPNRWYEVGDSVGGNAWQTMCTQPWRDRVGSHCLKCHKQTDDVELCISPVYWRLAVAKFSKCTM